MTDDPEKYLWLHEDSSSSEDEDFIVGYQDNSSGEGELKANYGETKDDCCCEPNNCPCYPFDGDAKSVRPPEYPEQTLPNLELDETEVTYAENYVPALMHAKAAQFLGKSHLSCPESEEECGEDVAGLQGSEINGKGCCGVPVTSKGGIPISPDKTSEKGDPLNQWGYDPADALTPVYYTTHDKCFSLVGNLRVWFWVLPYWQPPAAAYLGKSPIDANGMYQTTPAGPPGSPEDMWIEGLVGIMKARPQKPEVQQTGLGLFETSGNWGWFYRNLGPTIGSGGGQSGPSPSPALGSNPGGQMSFYLGGGSSPDHFPFYSPKPMCWQFFHMDCHYPEEVHMHSDPDATEATFLLSQGVSPGTGDNKCEECVSDMDGNATLIINELSKKRKVDGAATGATDGEPGDNQLFIGWNKAYETKGKLGYGGEALTQAEYWKNCVEVAEQAGEVLPAEPPWTLENPESCTTSGQARMGGWLISNVGFHKSSKQEDGGDPRPDLTAEALFNGGEGVPCDETQKGKDEEESD